MKRGLVPLFLAVLAPAVLAQDQGIFGNAFSLIFGSVSGSPANDMVLKVGLWLALTMVLFQGAQKIFKTKDANGQEIGSKKLSIIFALIISTIAVRFMPPFISEGLGAMTWIAALILLPYTLVSFVTDNKWTKVIATGIFVILIWALFSSYGAPFVFPYIRGNNFLSDLFYMMTPQAWMIPVMAIGTILIIFFIVSAKGAPSPGGGGSSASSGLFGKALGGLGKAIAAPFKAVGHGLSGLGKGIGYAWLGLGKGVGAAAHGTGRLAGGAIGGIGKGIGAAVPYVGKGIGHAAGGIAHGIGAGAKGVGELGGVALGKGVPVVVRGIGKSAVAAGKGFGRAGGWLRNRLRRKPKIPVQPTPTEPIHQTLQHSAELDQFRSEFKSTPPQKRQLVPPWLRGKSRQNEVPGLIKGHIQESKMSHVQKTGPLAGRRSPEMIEAKIREHESKLALSKTTRGLVKRRAVISAYKKLQRK